MNIAILGLPRSGTSICYRVARGMLRPLGYRVLYEPFSPSSWTDMRRVRHFPTGIYPTDHHALPERVKQLFIKVVKSPLFMREETVRRLIYVLGCLDKICLKEVFTLRFVEDYVKAGFKVVALVPVRVCHVVADNLYLTTKLALNPIRYYRYKITNRLRSPSLSAILSELKRAVTMPLHVVKNAGKVLEVTVPQWAHVEPLEWVKHVVNVWRRYPDRVHVYIYEYWINKKDFARFLRGVLASP